MMWLYLGRAHRMFLCSSIYKQVRSPAMFGFLRLPLHYLTASLSDNLATKAFLYLRFLNASAKLAHTDLEDLRI